MTVSSTVTKTNTTPAKSTSTGSGVKVTISNPSSIDIKNQLLQVGTQVAYAVARGNLAEAAKAQTTQQNLQQNLQNKLQPATATPNQAASSLKPGMHLYREDVSYQYRTDYIQQNTKIVTTNSRGTSEIEDVRRQSNDDLVYSLNKKVEELNLVRINAAEQGNSTRMRDAAIQIQNYQVQGATLGMDASTPAAKALRDYYNGVRTNVVSNAMKSLSQKDLDAALIQAKNDHLYAVNTKDADAMAAAASLGDALRGLGATIPKEFNLEQAKSYYQSRYAAPAVTPPVSKLTTPAAGISDSTKQKISLAADFAPGVGNAKASYEVVTGENPITGEPLSAGERWLAAAGVVLGPLAKGAANGLKYVSDLANAVTDAQKAQKIRTVDHNVLDKMEQSGGHLMEKHVGIPNEELIRRAIQNGLDVSTFTDKSTAIKAVQENIRRNADEIVQWLNDAEVDARKAFEASHSHPIGKGVREDTKQVTYNLTESKIILVKDSSQELGFRILTGFPVVD